MMFLIRTAFWLMILVLLLPTDEKQQSQVYGTAEAAVKDVTGFCDRNPSVCEKGKDAFDVFVHKAQFGAQIIMGFVKEQTVGTTGEEQAPAELEAPAETLVPAPSSDDAPGLDATPAQVSQAMPAWMPASLEPDSVESVPSQNTLRSEDLAPAWNGPRAGV